VNCPKCGAAMGRMPLPSGVEIDVCEDHGVWLDVGELERIVQFQSQRRGAGGAGRAAAPRQAPGLGSQIAKGMATGMARGAGSGLASSLVRSLFR
jgi:Zn-finger nucleic acid-binding protein